MFNFQRKKFKKSYEVSRKCQYTWALAFPWAKMQWSQNGEVHQVKFIVWSLVWRKDVFMGPKSNTFYKHAINRKATKNMPHIEVKKNKWYIKASWC